VNLLQERIYYKPFEYPKAYDYYRKQQLVHWIKDEIKIAEDLQNWHYNITDTEKDVIGGILKGFTQIEVTVGDYWRKVCQWFPKAEIAMMCSTFSYFENIHQDAYALINETLGLDDFTSFLYDDSTRNKLEYFINIPIQSSIEDKAKSLAIFSAFAEGCMLFSSFAVLLSFQKENLMKGVSQIVNYSVRDESLHSEGGCWLFNTLCSENEGLRESVKEDIMIAAVITYELEEKFIDNLFNNSSIRTLTSFDLKEFVKHRINNKLKEIGYNSIYIIDENSLKRMEWFDALSSGREFSDFFANRVSEYTQVNYNINDLF
jgi:ribonucleoside-diphosphate reductase beta chain